MSVATLAPKARLSRNSLDRLLVAVQFVLGILVAAGVVAGIWRLAMGLGSTTALTDSVPWGIWIGLDFSLIAFSGAAFTMAGLVYILRREEFRPALRPAVLTGLLGYMAVLVLLVLDLGRPDRFYHFIIFWNMHSPLFEICWCVLLYTTVLMIEVSPQILEKLGRVGWAHRVHQIIVPVAIVAVTLSSLHQSTLGTLYLNMSHRLHPLWFTPLLPVLFFISAVMVGLSMGAISYRAAARVIGGRMDNRVFTGLARAAGWVALLYFVLKVGELALAGEMPALLTFDAISRRMWAELVLVALPVVLLLAPQLKQNRRVLALGVVLLAAGVLLNRFNATLFAQLAPDSSAYAPHPAEWISTIGVIAAAMLAWLLGVRLLHVFEGPEKTA